MSRFKVLLAVALFASALFPAACSLGDGACLRMSDCDAPFKCVEGTCRSNETLLSASALADGGIVEASDQ